MFVTVREFKNFRCLELWSSRKRFIDLIKVERRDQLKKGLIGHTTYF